MSMGLNGSMKSVARDLTAGMVVFLVALPLCLGVALASKAPLFSGLLAGIIGGILVGILSGSNTSVSGPAAGLTAIVVAQIAVLGSFQNFLLAVVIAGLIQIALGVFRMGFIAAFFPSSVIKGLLAAIGIILILKQTPHIFGHDADPEGEMAFVQPDQRNTFTELLELFSKFHPGAAVVGLLSIAVLVTWEKVKLLKKSPIPGPLVVVLVGVGISLVLKELGRPWEIGASHLVQVPVSKSVSGFLDFLQWPNFSEWRNPAIYTSAVTIALVASLETLLNLEAVDKIDPKQRVSPPSRELVAQGIGNFVSGMVGGIPVTSVIVRSSVNINAKAQSKLSAIFHGVLLLSCVMFLPTYLNLIPLSCLAAILLVTGAKLASPAMIRQMWDGGKNQFLPFLITVVAIVFTDLLKGIVIGWAVSIGFILYSSARRPMRRISEKHLGGEVLHIELANQVSFLNRGALVKILDEVPVGGHLLIDASNTNYIDPDILDLIRDFKEQSAPARGIELSLRGFRTEYQIEDQIQFVDYSTRELQEAVTPQQVLEILKTGHERFRSGNRLARDLTRQVNATADVQHPLAVILSCIDSRSPTELIFDSGLGELLSVRIHGNVPSRKVLGSLEYGCAVAGAKLILVLGHTRCSAVSAAVTAAQSEKPVAAYTGCEHVGFILQEIQESVHRDEHRPWDQLSSTEKETFIDSVAQANVLHTVKLITTQSQTLARLVKEGRIAIVGAMYDVTTGDIKYL